MDTFDSQNPNDAQNKRQEALDILHSIDTGTLPQTCDKISAQLGAAIKLLEEAGEAEEQILPHRYDYHLCLLRIRTYFINKNGSNPKERVLGMAQLENGLMFPDPNGLPLEALSYFEKRLQERVNPVLQARYADYLYEKTTDKKKRRAFALLAIDAYLQSAELFRTSPDDFRQLEFIVCLDHAAFLVGSVGSATKIVEVAQVFLKYIMEYGMQGHLSKGHIPQASIPTQPPQTTTQISEVSLPDDSGAPASASKVLPGRWMADVAQILLHLSEHRILKKSGASAIDEASLKQVQQIMIDVACAYRKNNDFPLEQIFLSVAIQYATHRKSYQESFDLKYQLGESIEAQGDWEAQRSGGSHLTAATFYENAVQYYIELRDEANTPPSGRPLAAQKIPHFKRKMRKAHRDGRGEFGFMVTPFDVPSEEVEAVLQRFLATESLEESLDRIGKDLFPSVTDAKNTVDFAKQNAPLFAMLHRSTSADDMTVARTSDEKEKDQALLNFCIEAQIRRNSFLFLHISFQRLVEEKGLTAANLWSYLDSWGHIDEDNEGIIRVGLERYFAQDYTSALHILVPQFEDVLRTLFDDAGLDIIKQRTKVQGKKTQGWNFETFDGFLSTLKGTWPQAMSEDLSAYIRIVMTEQTGWNLRNRIAHGLIDPQQCIKPVADTILHLFLAIMNLNLNVPENQSESSDSANP